MIEVGGFQATVRMERLWPPVMVERRAEGETLDASSEAPGAVGEAGGAPRAEGVVEEEEAGKEVREYIRTVLSAKQVARMGRVG